ncbi:site-specific DNA-methyltransferase [Pseudomonas sp. HY7a-MNA-CIBAN-0227]|uniref:site-specific DNA-methyltransferase n=1 Tax=Pseudomonas sp. HY7a-MNA-CIBAN-0227 TaxID=3140474 RepID=UPI00331A5FAC
MPTLHWVGKDQVRNHHRDVPYRVLRDNYKFEAPQPAPKNSLENRIIQGDNLEALKSLLPEFEGRVKCVYIDPPYNTGNESWVYNDNVNDPRIKRWLGKVVGKENEDMSRQDKWLCMMYPRLKLLHRLLSEDGSIWVSIDDNAVGILRPILDEIFGVGNFVTCVIWEKADSPRNSANQFSTDHDYILVYSKRPNWVPARLARTAESDSIYTNDDDDPNGPWIPGDPFANKPYSKGLFTITGPTGRQFSPPPGRYWRVSEERLRALDAEGRVWWGPKGEARPSIKRYLNEVGDLVPRTLWKKDVGSNRTSKNEMRAIFSDTSSFDTPKPSTLIGRILDIAADDDSIILDSFAGSGTTAHAVLKANAQDEGSRRFVLIELMDYAESLTAERVRRVISGYGDGTKQVAGLGGGFTYQTLAEPLFVEYGNLNPEAGLAAIRDYVAWQEGIYQQFRADYEEAKHRYWLGEANGLRVFFAYEADAITTFDLDLLAELVQTVGPVLVYADQLALGEDFMRRHSIGFKKIPRDIARL